MELKDVGNVVTLSGSDDVDMYLAAGWVLLFVGQHAGENFAEICYSLGWLKDAGTPVYPSRYKRFD